MARLVTLITCTGFRPEAFGLCRYFVERQTYKGEIQWIIVTDEPGLKIPASTNKHIHIEQHQAPRAWTPDYNTHRGNMELALTKVSGDYVFIIEDDDHYHPRYVQSYLDLLGHVDVVGISHARYYHAKIAGWKLLQNDRHASLSSTAFHKRAMPHMVKAVNSGDMYFDRDFWLRVHDNKLAYALIGNSNLSTGIKGLPGREGITPSHKELRDYMLDLDISKLREWVGSDYSLYKPFSKRINNASEKLEQQVQRPPKTQAQTSIEATLSRISSDLNLGLAKLGGETKGASSKASSKGATKGTIATTAR